MYRLIADNIQLVKVVEATTPDGQPTQRLEPVATFYDLDIATETLARMTATNG